MPETRDDVFPTPSDEPLGSSVALFETRFDPETNTWERVSNTPRYFRSTKFLDGTDNICEGVDKKLGIRVMFKGFAQDENVSEETYRRWIDRLKHEAVLTANTRSKELIVVYDFIWDEEAKEGWIVLEDLHQQGFLSLEELRYKSALEKINSSQIIEVVRLIADALQQLRAKGVSHRDIKPANLMYRFATEHEEAALKIIDLGAAIKGMGHQSFKGTPAYASYENIHRLPENEFSDTFVLGLLIHFLFAGNSPMTIVDPSRGKKDFDLYTVENEPYDLANYPKVVERLSELGINQNNFRLLINLALLQKTTISDTQGEKLTPTQLAERFASLFPTTPPEVL